MKRPEVEADAASTACPHVTSLTDVVGLKRKPVRVRRPVTGRSSHGEQGIDGDADVALARAVCHVRAANDLN